MEIIKELKKIQKELKAPKSQFNNFGKYKYRSLEDITEAFKKIDTDAILTLSDEIIEINNRFYIKATAIIQVGDEKISSTGWARESLSKKGMDESQITGATSTYARKYALNGLFSIDDTKDMDIYGDKKTNDSIANQELEKHNKIMEIINKTEDIGLLTRMYSKHKKSGELKICNAITKKAKAVKEKISKNEKIASDMDKEIEEINPNDIDY